MLVPIPTTPRKKLLTPAEVAAELGVAEQTLAVWRTTKRYPLAYQKVGRLVRYRAEDVESFLESRAVSCD